METGDTKEKKKVLITYFENFGKKDNSTCTSLKNKLEEKSQLLNYNSFDFMAVRTCKSGFSLCFQSKKDIEKELSHNKYDYIISFGKFDKDSIVLERLYKLYKYEECYALDFTKGEKKFEKEIFNFRITTSIKCKLWPPGACYRLRNLLVSHCHNDDIKTKSEFIHVGSKIPIENLDKLVDYVLDLNNYN